MSSSLIVKYIPIVQWLPKYNRLKVISDIVAGITLGLTMIPQSIAYAALAGLTAQYGLYSSFVGGFIYVFFGTTKEVSIGPTSLMALLTFEYTRDTTADFKVLLCFLTGCVELMMGLLNLGFLVDFISAPVTSAFTSATSVIIIISQLRGLLGLKYKSMNTIDNVFKLFQNIKNVRIADMTLGFSSIAFLLIFRMLKDINFFVSKNNDNDDTNKIPIMKKVLWFLSIGRNALVVLIASTISFYLISQGSSPFILSGKVEPGLPAISLPPFSSQIGNRTYTFFEMCSSYGSGIFVVPLIAVLANVAIAKVFANGSSVNATQEMLTLGVCNILGSFVSSMPSCGAFTRSAVSTASGVQSPMAGLYSGIMALMALSFLTPYFYYIPRATLSAVLITAVIFLIDWRIIKVLWVGCKKDAITALATFFISIVCSIEVGLLFGITFNVISVLRPSARPKFQITDCKTGLGNQYILIKPDTGLYYPAINFFCNTLTDIAKKHEKTNIPLIVDCNSLRSFDYSAVKGIENLSKRLNAKEDRLWFLNVNRKIMKSIKILATDLKNFKFVDNEARIDSFIQPLKIKNDEPNYVDENDIKIKQESIKESLKEDIEIKNKDSEEESTHLLVHKISVDEKTIITHSADLNS